MDRAGSSWEVYILRTRTGALYTGITTDLDRRIQEHRTGRRGARFFRLSPPVEVVFRERHPDRASASRREAAIKRLNRRQKLALLTIPSHPGT